MSKNRGQAPPLHRCFVTRLTGTIKARFHAEGAGQTTSQYFGDPSINNTTMTVHVYNRCGTGRVAARATKLELRQYYYDRACQLRPSVSAGASASTSSVGLSIGISVTSVCNEFMTGYRSSVYGRSSRYEQDTSGAGVYWAKRVGIPNSTFHPVVARTVCVTGEYQLQPYVTTSHDDLLKFRFSDICISRKF